MATVFGTTLGGKTTDMITTSYRNVSSTNTRTWSIHAYIAGTGNASGARIWVRGNADGQGYERLIYNATNTRLEYLRAYSTTHGQWSCPRPSLNAWHHILVRHVLGSNPTMWIDGVAQTVSTIASPSGTVINTDFGPFILGNRPALDRNFDGMLSRFAIWDASIAGGPGHPEQYFLWKGVSPNEAPITQLVYFEPLNPHDRRFGPAPASVSAGLAKSNLPLLTYDTGLLRSGLEVPINIPGAAAFAGNLVNRPILTSFVHGGLAG